MGLKFGIYDEASTPLSLTLFFSLGKISLQILYSIWCPLERQNGKMSDRCLITILSSLYLQQPVFLLLPKKKKPLYFFSLFFFIYICNNLNSNVLWFSLPFCLLPLKILYFCRYLYFPYSATTSYLHNNLKVKGIFLSSFEWNLELIESINQYKR